MAKSDWQVGPVLKDKLGSQGTLFRGGTKYSSDRRYPKGYTPERQQEVADAVVRPSVRNTLDKGVPAPEVSRGMQSTWFKDRPVRTGIEMDSPTVNQSAQPTRRLVDNIARSTVPVEHLSGVQFRTNADEAHLGANVAGHHSVRGDALSKGEPVIRLGPGYESTDTTIHEIGHHVSHQQGNAWRANYAFHTDEGGHEEAFADNYADTHYRDQKGKPGSRGTYGGGEYHLDRSPEFWSGYRSNRHYGSSDYIATENAKYYKAFPEEQMHPDGSMDQPLIHKERAYGGYTDKGQETHDTLGDINDDALPPPATPKYDRVSAPSHFNFDWSKYSHG